MICDLCGGDAFRPATRREQLARWFIGGAGAASAWYCRSCSASWSGGSGYGVLVHASRSGFPRRLRLPFEVVEALREARRWHPVPVFYAAVGGIVLAPAVTIAALTRSAWWVPLVAVPVAVTGAFLWSLTSALGRGARRDVLWRLDPELAWRRDLDDEVAGIREQIGGFGLLVPEAWPGELSLDGADWSMTPRGGRVLQGVTVVADQGDPELEPDRDTPGWRPPTPRVEIHLTSAPWNDLEGHARSELAERTVQPAPPDREDAEQARKRWEIELAERWRDSSMQVDGVAIATRVLTLDDADIGVATFLRDSRTILVIAEGIDPDTIALVSVTDPASLADEFELRRRRIFAQTSG